MEHYLRLLKYLKPYWKRATIMLILMFLISGMLAGIIMGLKPLIEIIVGDFDVSQYQEYAVFQHPLGERALTTLQGFVVNDRMKALAFVAIFILLMQLLRGACEVLQLYLANYITGRVEIDLTSELQSKLLDQPLSFFEAFGTSGIISIAWNDTQALVRGLNLILSKRLQQPLNIVAAVVVALTTNWQLASVALLGVPVAGYGASRFARYARSRASIAFKDIALTLSVLQEEFYGLKIIKAFTMEERERVRFRGAVGRLFRNRMRIVKAKGWNSPLTETIGGFGIGFLLILGGREVVLGQMTSGSLMMLFGALLMTYQPVKGLSKAYADLQVVLASADRVFGLMDTVPLVIDAPDAVEMPRARGDIEFEGMSFSYNGKDLVLKDVNLHIEPGETVALVGYSGAGKTTLANLIMRFYDVGAGRITMDGHDVRQVTQKSLRENIGLVTQDTVLFDGTIAENIAAMNDDIDRERVIEAAKAANADEFIKELADGYDTEIGERGGRLSGGQQQRLAIARTIYKAPPVFILDEATSSLDSYNEELVQEALGRLMAGRTTIIIAHRFSTIAFADRIIVLNKGEVEMTGTMQECLKRSETFRILYEKQFPGRVLAAWENDIAHAAGIVRGKAFEERFDDSPVLPLYSEEQLQLSVAGLRKMLAEDDAPERIEALNGEIAKGIDSFRGHWFQRIDYPEHGITSTSNHEWAYMDEGGLNTLENRLTSEEASILRPWPKWSYIKPILGDIKGKSVLEIGSSNGFFSFRFAELGAEKVTGVEIIRRQHESAVWSADVLKHDNVSFLHADVLMDLTLPEHDIVFLSEVHNHFLFPFYGLLRIINLAGERVILDAGIADTGEQGMTLHSAWDKKSNTLIYQHFQLTDGLVMDYLNLIGVSSSRIKRYKAPNKSAHILYDIDTKGLRKAREELGYPEYVQSMVNLAFTMREG